MRHGAALALLSLVGLAALAPPTAAQTDELAAVPRISQAEFKALVATGQVVVVDTRDETAYANGHIPGAISMPLDQVKRRVPLLKNEKRPIVTYCA